MGVNVALDQKRDEIIQLIGFHVGRKLYGTDIMNVREILRDPEIESVEENDTILEGVIHLRGETIPVIDMHHCLGSADQRQARAKNWVLVIETGARLVAYLVDAVTQIVRVARESILPPPEIILVGLRSPYIRGVCETKIGLLVMLDMNRILLSEEQKKIRQLTMV